MRTISIGSAIALLCWLAPLSHAETILRAVVKDAKGEKIPDAVVSLHAIGDQLLPPPATTDAPIEIVQQNQEYIPYVTVIRAGSTVEFPNKDDIQHHIYSLSKAKRFEKPLYAPGARESIVFDQPGIVTLGCNIHDWMVAYLVVLPTPFFGKSDATGTAFIALPAGKYRLEVWHPRMTKTMSRDVALADADSSMEFVVTLKPDRRIRRAPETKGGGY